jgi:hypothetical protein
VTGIKTKIASTDRTWNPWVGCRKVSPGCKHCYMFSPAYVAGPNARVGCGLDSPRKQWAELHTKLFTCAAHDTLTLCVSILSASNTAGGEAIVGLEFVLLSEFGEFHLDPRLAISTYSFRFGNFSQLPNLSLI